MARCPAHDDRIPSLSVSQGDDGRILLHCHAGCPTDVILERLGLTYGDLCGDGPRPAEKKEMVETYDYRAPNGTVLYQVVRFEPKDFRQRRPDGSGGWVWHQVFDGVKRVLYRLPELLEANPERWVFIVEGEKSANRLADLGLVVTTNSGGAGKWHLGGAEYIEPLRNRNVAILPDNDPPGQEHANHVASSLIGVASRVRIVELPGVSLGGDICTWLDNGGTLGGLKQLVSEAPDLTEPATSQETQLTPYPKLPQEALLDAGLGVGAASWLDAYVEYASNISPMTPALFHESAGLWLASIVIARRLRVPMAFGDIYPNLFIVWVAPTTLFRKTTALSIARGIAHRAFPFLLAAQDTTPEAFLSDLAGLQPNGFDDLSEQDQNEWRMSRDFAAQRGWVLDELSGLLSSAGKDYNAGLLEAVIRFHDCDERFSRSTQAQGHIVVRNSYLSLLGASTPAAMAPHITFTRLWFNGFWPRFAILTPQNERPEWRVPQDASEPPMLVKRLQSLHKQLPTAEYPNAPTALSVVLGEGVYDAWMRLNKALSYDLLTLDLPTPLWATYGRLPVMLMKVAIILAALDWADEDIPTIGISHLARALSIVEGWRASAHRVLSNATTAKVEDLRERILARVGEHGEEGATARDVYRNMPGVGPETVKKLLDEMAQNGVIDRLPAPTGRTGRPTIRYRARSG
jgi:hypothetical protein